MKITRLKTWQVPPRWLFLKIETDEGAFGWGEPVIEERSKVGHRWRNPLWTHADGSVAEW